MTQAEVATFVLLATVSARLKKHGGDEQYIHVNAGVIVGGGIGGAGGLKKSPRSPTCVRYFFGPLDVMQEERAATIWHRLRVGTRSRASERARASPSSVRN